MNVTETEKKALALLNETCAEMSLDKVRSLELNMPGERALLRAIEQHEAYKQEVSDVCEGLLSAFAQLQLDHLTPPAAARSRGLGFRLGRRLSLPMHSPRLRVSRLRNRQTGRN